MDFIGLLPIIIIVLLVLSGLAGAAELSNNENTISNCKIYNNKVNGIYLYSSSDNIIMDCEIINNGDGNIIMNKDSNNNQITSSYKTIETNYDSYNTNHGTSSKHIIQLILDRISKIKSKNIYKNKNSR
jgi:parallel beta-helix repeat protein